MSDLLQIHRLGQRMAEADLSLPEYEQTQRLGWYERELTRLHAEAGALVDTIDRNYAARLEEEHASRQAVKALALDATRSAGASWDERTGTPLDDTED